jgi:hypothetical protein
MVTFNFTYDPGVTVQQALGFETAGRIWSHFLSDPATLNLHVGMSSTLPTNVIGGALPGIASNVKFSQALEQLRADSTSVDDQVTTSTFNSFTIDLVGFRCQIQETGHSLQLLMRQSSMNVTRANAKALGLLSGDSPALDGTIVMGNLENSRFHWNYDFTRSSTATVGSLDFLSVALHEIGHILGFVSGVDTPGLVSEYITNSQFAAYIESAQKRVKYSTPLDLFRRESRNETGYGRDMTYGSSMAVKAFTLRDMSPTIAEFATGKYTGFNGDGFQASHWKEQAVPLGIMDPAIAPEERVSISNIDLRAFDVIGWDLRNGSSTRSFNPTFLDSLHNQAVSALASRLGQTTTWITNNPTVAPTNLGRDRTSDVEAMIQASDVYEWGTTGSGRVSNKGRRWIEVFNQMASNQEVYVNFSTVSQVAPPPEMMTSAELEQGSSQSGSNYPLAPTDATTETYPSDRPLPPDDATVGTDERAWEAIGSGGNDDRHPPHSWSISTGQNSGSDKDPLSGVESVNPLVGNGVFEGFDPGATPSVDFPVTTSEATTTAWAPVVTWMAEGVAASELPVTTSSSPRQQPANIAVSDPNMLLGHENNPLVQNSLLVGLMGAIA